MKRRCLYPTDRAYKNYGGRGITVCRRWLKFENFLADMGDLPFEGAEIERIDNSKGYFKKNCKWATKIEQANNKRNNRILIFGGEAKTLAQWSRVVGMNMGSIRSRILQRGWSVERALTQPVRRMASR
jgi:hypothetical protein